MWVVELHPKASRLFSASDRIDNVIDKSFGRQGVRMQKVERLVSGEPRSRIHLSGASFFRPAERDGEGRDDFGCTVGARVADNDLHVVISTGKGEQGIQRPGDSGFLVKGRDYNAQ